MNKELETIIENEFDCLINDLGCLIGEEWKAESIKKVVNQAFVLGGVSSSMGCSYSITPRLRYAKKQIYIDQGVKYELRLQQMWQGSEGSEDWRWVEVIE